MGLLQLVYSSRPFGFDLSMLGNILMKSRRNNARNDVTGALICRADLYLQWLEGPQDKVEYTYTKILKDDRHLDVVLRLTRPSSVRLFPEWSMRDDPADGWLWSKDEIDDGVLDRAKAVDFISVFERVRDLALKD
ncbi:MAG: BLUF domain-containing protein [Notoacmeibacter sp.]